MSTLIRRDRIGNFYIESYEVDGKASPYPPHSVWSWEALRTQLIGKEILEIKPDKEAGIYITLRDIRLHIFSREGEFSGLLANEVEVVNRELPCPIHES